MNDQLTAQQLTDGNNLIVDLLKWEKQDKSLVVMPEDFCKRINNNGRLWNIRGLSFSSNWQWQVPVWSKVAHLTQKAVSPKTVSKNDSDLYLQLTDKYEAAIFTDNVAHGYQILIETILFYNKLIAK